MEGVSDLVNLGEPSRIKFCAAVKPTSSKEPVVVFCRSASVVGQLLGKQSLDVVAERIIPLRPFAHDLHSFAKKGASGARPEASGLAPIYPPALDGGKVEIVGSGRRRRGYAGVGMRGRLRRLLTPTSSGGVRR